MRYDLNVLWVEDTKDYYEEMKDILDMYAEDLGVSVYFEYIQDIRKFYETIQNDFRGFKKYDICFIDYALSDDVVGSNVIKDLRRENVDVDILFYSSENEADIVQEILDNIGTYQGVYIANKGNFEEKSYGLIRKNSRRLTSLANIRGFLMDQTSENDYTIKSYILRKFDSLQPHEKREIADLLAEYITAKKDKFTEHAKTTLDKLTSDGITNINRTMDLMVELFPIDLKYKVFEKMIEFQGEESFKDFPVTRYTEEIIKARNTLAHKKLDICKTQEYILYYDTVKQYESRQCPDDCAQHTDDNKYSTIQWQEIRKNTLTFGKAIDDLQKKL